MPPPLNRFWPVFVCVFLCLPLFLGLGRTDLQGDEAIYSFAVDVILETGDWLVPKSSPGENTAFLEKPPLKFWIVAAPIRLGLLPRNEFGLRFWDALFGCWAFLYVFGIGRRLAGPVCGAVAVLILFVHGPLIFDHGLRSNNMEAPLFLAYCGGIYHYLRWAAADSTAGRGGHMAAVAMYFVLGFMTKFVAVLFLPLVLGTASLIIEPYRRRFVRDWRRWLAIGLGALAIMIPWFVFAYAKFGAALWHSMVGAAVYTRLTFYLDPMHVQPWHFYFVDLYRTFRASESLPLVLPGIILLAAHTWRRRSPEGIVLLLWGLLPIGMISLTTSKLSHYAYPFLPPLAIAGGYLASWLLVTVQPRFVDAVKAVERWIAVRLPRLTAVMYLPVIRAVLLSMAAVAIVLTVVTVLHGPVRFSVGGGVVFRNAGVIRPWVVALVLTMLAGHSARVSRISIPLLIVWMVAILPYPATIERTLIEKHPLRSARDCMRVVQARIQPSAPHGLYVEASDLLLYEDVFYFRQVRPWEYDLAPSDSALHAAIDAPGTERPVLISVTRYQDFLKRTRPARESRPSPAMLNLPMALLILPGPYGVCGPSF